MIALRAFVSAFLGWCGTQTALAATSQAEENPVSHEATPAAVTAGHAAPGAEHVSAVHEEENLSFSDVNWYYGLIGEKAGAEPGLLWRPPGMPAPFLATALNWLVLVSLIFVFAKNQLPAALKKRKAGIVSGMEEAGRIKAQAQSRLSELETKLSHVDEEIELLKAEMQRTSELERERILQEAEERRNRMERDASRLIETELEGAKDQLRREVVKAALEQASQAVKRELTGQDQQSLFDEALGSLQTLPSNSLGGRA